MSQPVAYKTMRAASIMFLLMAAGCSHYDPRLLGTWHSNRDATIAAAFERDPHWSKAPLERVARFKDMFGHMTITYERGMIKTDYRGKIESCSYQVLERGSNYVVIHADTPLDKDQDIRIRFVDDNTAYWIDTGPLGNGLEERFDKALH